jgi:predicted ATP-grasp superfamily ATP-dependent carboligase
MNDFSHESRYTDGLLSVKGSTSLDADIQQASYPVTYDALVLDAKQRQSLVTVRSLGSRGLRVAALEASNSVPTFSSRWCQRGFHAPSYEQGPEPYLVFLEQLLTQTGARVLIPSSDATIGVMREHRQQLVQRAHLALAQEAALHIALNKERTLEVASQLGIRNPRGVIVKSMDEVEEAIREIGLPAVVKPVESWAWGKQRGVGLTCKLVITREEAHRIAEEFTSLGMAMLFQQYLSGRREAISFIFAKGRIYARFAQWAKRTDPPLGGISVFRQSIAIPPDIGMQAERLVREIELEGYSEVEFRRDEIGSPYLMEINARLSASVEVAVRAGVDFPFLLYQWATGDQLSVVEGYHTGGWMRYLEGDFWSTLGAVQLQGRPEAPSATRAVLDFCTSFFMPTGYDYLDWKDPLPAWRATANFAHYVTQQVKRKISKRISR